MRPSRHLSPQARNAKRTAIPRDEESADALIASIIEGRADEYQQQDQRAAA